MIKTYTVPRSRVAQLASAFLLMTAIMTGAQNQITNVITASIVFRDGSSVSIIIPPSAFKLETIAGRLTLSTAGITDIIRPDKSDLLTISMTTGERWCVTEQVAIEAVFGKDTASSILAEGQSVQKISFAAAGRHPNSFNQCCKVLFNDGSMAIIYPSEVTLPVSLESGSAEIPLGAVRSIRFAIPEGTDVPDSVFVRILSEHVFQFPWNARRNTFKARSISDNNIRIAYADIMGILPLSSNSPSSVGGGPSEEFRLESTDGTVLARKIPFQLWTFNTDVGSITLPSPLVTSFTVPVKWREQGEIKTIYGETYRGTPVFKNIYLWESDQKTVSAAIGDLANVTRQTSLTLAIPREAAVFHLTGGRSVLGIACTFPIPLLTQNGESAEFQQGNSLTRALSGDLMLEASGGEAIPCKPSERTLDACLVVNGEKVNIAWREVERIEYSSQIRQWTEPVAADVPGGDAEDEPDDSLARGQRDVPPPDGTTPPELITLQMPWGDLNIETNEIAVIHAQQQRQSAVIQTTTGDYLVAEMTSRRVRRGMEGLLDRMQGSADPAAIPPFNISVRGTTGGNITIRFMRGDIMTGTLPDADIPFRSVEPADPRTGIPSTSLRKIMRNGRDEFIYVTDRGTFTGKVSRDPLVFSPAIGNTLVEIPLNEIDSLSCGNEPLPPPVGIGTGLPPALRGEVYLPGGEFRQGGGDTAIADEMPPVQVMLSPFLLDSTEITRAQFTVFVEETGYQTTAEESGSVVTWLNPGFLQMPDDPVACVSWMDAITFCNWRSKSCGLPPVYTLRRDGTVLTDRTAAGYRLPTESEWEFAAGGVRAALYPWGGTTTLANSAPLPANFMQKDGRIDDGWRWTNPVKAFAPDDNGIYGMSGNVWEWCEDWYFERAYDAIRNRTPLDPCIQAADVPGLTHRVMRGGSYRNSLDMLRTASRGNGLPRAYAPHVGFRCARNGR